MEFKSPRENRGFLFYKYNNIMNDELVSFIQSKLGDHMFDELEVDPEHYNTLPAYEYYNEIIRKCEWYRPDIVKEFNDKKQRDSVAPASYIEKRKKDYAEDLDTAFSITYDALFNPVRYSRVKIFTTPNTRACTTVFLNQVKDKGADAFLEYIKENPKGFCGNSRINCVQMQNFIKRMARLYITKYMELHKMHF